MKNKCRVTTKNNDMKRKYADMYYSVKKEKKGWTWKIFFNYKGKRASQKSKGHDVFDSYSDTETAARMDAIEAIQDHYT